MALSQDQLQTLLNHINARWRNKACAICGVNNWTFNGPVSLSINPALNQMMIGGPQVPVAVATCRHCGNTVLINLVVAGLVNPNA